MTSLGTLLSSGTQFVDEVWIFWKGDRYLWRKDGEFVRGCLSGTKLKKFYVSFTSAFGCSSKIRLETSIKVLIYRTSSPLTRFLLRSISLDSAFSLQLEIVFPQSVNAIYTILNDFLCFGGDWN